MPQTQKKKRIFLRRRRLKVWQRLALVLFLGILLSFSSTLFTDFHLPKEEQTAEATASPEGSGWTEPVYAYVVAEEGEYTAPFYNEALAVVSQMGRGTYIEVENWTPFVSESGNEYYHVYQNGQMGYMLCDNITDDRSEVVHETQVYVRTPVNLMQEPDSLEMGSLVRKGDLLRIVGYDYLREDGRVNMYEVKLGEEIGWIYANYVVNTYVDSLKNWTNDEKVYDDHVYRGDQYGGGNAADLDYWPHEKGDFADEGNVMPESCNALYLAPTDCTPDTVAAYLEMAEGTAVNTFVLTIFDDGEIAYPSDVMESYGLMDNYGCLNTLEGFAEAVQMIKDKGYYLVGRITCFKDGALARAYPEWAITDRAGVPMEINYGYWPSVFCREVWELKVGLAVEVVESFGFNEIQFDYIRFPDYIINYEEDGSADLKNHYNESKAQAVQRFLIYAKDVLHNHGVYVSADVFGETSNTYVAPYGQYWPAISTVVDVISGMPYPDHYSSYWTNSGVYFRPYKNPYKTLHDWAERVQQRQAECSSPAIVRTWIQTWDDADYKYDVLAMQRQITGLYDWDITGGFMPWYGPGTIQIEYKIRDVVSVDYYKLYKEAEDEGMLLSEYMGIDTSE